MHNYYQALRATWDPQLLPGPSCYLGPTTTTRPFVLIYAHNYYQVPPATWDTQLVPGPSCSYTPTIATSPFELLGTHNYYQARRANIRPRLLPGPSCYLGPTTTTRPFMLIYAHKLPARAISRPCQRIPLFSSTMSRPCHGIPLFSLTISRPCHRILFPERPWAIGAFVVMLVGILVVACLELQKGSPVRAEESFARKKGPLVLARRVFTECSRRVSGVLYL